MRILICSDQPPVPPLNGVRLVVASLLPELAREHEVRVVTLCEPGQAGAGGSGRAPMRLVARPVERRRDTLRHLLAAMRTGRPMRLDEMARAMRGPLLEEMRTFEPDVVYVVSGSLAALRTAVSDRPAVLIALDAAYLNREADARAARGVRRRLLVAEAQRVRRFEAAEYRGFDRVVVVGEPDRAALHAIAPGLPVEIAPNGVSRTFSEFPEPDRRSATVVFHGALNYAPNVSAARHLARSIWPRVLRRRGDARLAIVGRSPTPRVRMLGRLQGVEVVGEVPDVRPWLAGARVYACPMLSGTGIKNKLLEAMACGMACVATPLALAGIAAVPGREVLLAGDAESFAGAVVRLLGDEDLASSLGAAAREYVRRRHDWAQVAKRYERVSVAAIDAHRRAGAAEAPPLRAVS